MLFIFYFLLLLFLFYIYSKWYSLDTLKKSSSHFCKQSDPHTVKMGTDSSVGLSGIDSGIWLTDWMTRADPNVSNMIQLF